MTVHNYRSRQIHETLNGVNPSSSFRDMRSSKSEPNLCQIWRVFGPWASPYGPNGQMTMTVHNYRPRQFHRTSNGENPSKGYRDMAAARPAAHPPARPPGPWRQYPSSPEGWGVKTDKPHAFFSPMLSRYAIVQNVTRNLKCLDMKRYVKLYYDVSCGHNDASWQSRSMGLVNQAVLDAASRS